VALFHLLNALRKEGALKLTCAHFEHGIRGAASIADRDFVKALAEENGVACIFDSADVPKEARISGEGLETCARRLRHAFLHRAKQLSGADVIALAHHRDDQAETVLMHILRGGGLLGASGMKMFDGEISRPLIGVSKAEIYRYLAETGASWREDETNRLPDTPRNILRLQALSLLEKAYPGAKEALARFSMIAQEENAHMERETGKAFSEHVRSFAGVFIVSGISDLDAALARRILRRLLPGADFETIERARLVSGSTILSAGARAFSGRDEIFIVPPLDRPENVLLPDEGECTLPGVCTLSVQSCESIPVMENGYEQALDAAYLAGACLRLRLPGDFMRPLGMGGRKKLLSDIFTDRKIPRPLRDRIPLVARESEIIWAAGVGISEGARVRSGCETRKLHIRMNNEIGGNTYAQ